MLKVNNKTIIREVAAATWKANKKRNFLTAFAIFLSTFLIATIISLGMSYWTTLQERQRYMSGIDYDIALSEPRDKQTKKARSMEQIKYAGLLVKCAIIEKYQDKTLDKARIYWADDTCCKNMILPALEKYNGHYPEKENELMLSSSILKSMGIKNPVSGMKLPLTYYTLEPSSDEALITKEFLLSGWFTDYSGRGKAYASQKFYKTTNVKPTDFTQGSLKIKLQNPLYSEKDILAMQNKLKLTDHQIIEADPDTISNFISTVICLSGMLLMVFASGYLFIYNTLYISVSKDIRYYGQLKTVGMTSVQLKKVINRQSFINALIGIPAGIAAALMAAKIIIPKAINLINPVMDETMVIPVNFLAFGTAALFALAVNKISSQKPASIAGNCSPIEAIRYTAVSGMSKTKHLKSKKRDGGSIFAMAMQNIFRDKKQAIVIFTSFTVAISVYLCTAVYIMANDGKNILGNSLNYDISFQNETTLEENKPLLTEEKIEQLEKTPGIRSVQKITSTEMVVPYQENVYGNYFKALYQTRYFPADTYKTDMENYKKDPASPYNATRLIGIDNAAFQKLNKSLGNPLNKKDFTEGKTAVAIRTFVEGDCGMVGKTVRFFLPEGTEPKTEHTIKIAATGGLEDNPAYFSGGIVPELIVSNQYVQKLMEKPYVEAVQAEYKEPYSEKTEAKALFVFQQEKEISHTSKLERYLEMKNTETKVKVLGNGIALIMSLLAVLNYLNMMAASVQNRSQELATLESIGMTAKQAKKMLGTEGAGYAAISIALSLLIGVPLSYIVFQSMNLYIRNTYTAPWGKNLLFFAIITFLCITIPVLLYHKTQKASIIERLHTNE